MPTKMKQTGRITEDEDLGTVLVISTTETTREGERTRREYYLLQPNPNSPHAFRIMKLVHSDEPQDVVYDVMLRGEHKGCDCPGHLQHSHCKHLNALLALRRAGKL